MTYTKYLEKIRNFSTNTIDLYTKYANELECFDRDYREYLASLPGYLSTNTIRLVISAIISYYKFLNDPRWKELKLPKKEIKVLDYISKKEYELFLKNINYRTKTGLAKRIIVRVLFETGVRASELLSIRKEDIKENKIKIHGKGRRERVVRVSDWLLSEIEEYIDDKKGKIFKFQYKNLYKKIRNLSKERKITPHMFRRGYAKYCFDMGASIYDISLSMGHSSLETTARYIKRSSGDVEIYKFF